MMGVVDDTPPLAPPRSRPHTSHRLPSPPSVQRTDKFALNPCPCPAGHRGSHPPTIAMKGWHGIHHSGGGGERGRGTEERRSGDAMLRERVRARVCGGIAADIMSACPRVASHEAPSKLPQASVLGNIIYNLRD